MASPQNILLVEGETDKLLFSVICDFAKIYPMIKVAPPKELGGGSNTKGSVFTILATLLNQLPDGTIRRLAVIVDADHPENNGMGYRKTLDEFARIAGKAGYTRISPKGLRAGILFGHNDGLYDLGLWIMPDNRMDGTLEHWLKHCVHQTDSPLYQNACRAIEAFAKPQKFSDLNRVKAEISTWLAWQRIPGQGAHAACRAGLIDRDKDLFAGLTDWLLRVFS
jgi:hypothetical protein